MNLFAIVENANERDLYRIPLSQNIQEQTLTMFRDLSTDFFREKDIIVFDGNYKAGDEELFKIEDFTIDDDVLSIRESSIDYDILDVENVEGKIKALFTNIDDTYCFQYFDIRKILNLGERGLNLFFNNNTYASYNKSGIVVSNFITCTYKDDTLYFKSFHNTRRIFDLKEYYQEATEEEVELLKENELFEFEDGDQFSDELTSFMRKKIKSIQSNSILQEVNQEDIRNLAKRVDLDFQYNDGKVVFRNDKQYCKKLLRFLDEDYFNSLIRKIPYQTNSKREI